MTSTPTKPTYYKSLTGIRAIAAIMIFVYHNRKYWKNILHPELFRFFNEFNLGVQLFFVLSGFLIAKSYGALPIQSFYAFRRYYIQRIIRIMPLYWLLLTLFYTDSKFGKFHFSIPHYLLFHGFSSKLSLDAISQSWSLSIEMTFYAFAPFLMLLLEKKFTYLILFLFSLFGSTILLGNLLFLLTGNIDNYFFPVDFVLMSTFVGQSIFFIAGMSLVKYDFFWEKFSLNKYLTTIGTLGFITTLYIIGCFQETRMEHGTNHWQGKLLLFILLPTFIVLLFKGLISERTYLQRFLSSKLMLLLGKASFAFYLIHISYINLKLKSFVFFPDRNFILLWLVSIALYYGFEKPIYDWFLKRYLYKSVPT